MPYRFDFIVNEPNKSPELAFTCKLNCVQCEALTARKKQCQRRVCIGTPFCATHLKTQMHLTIADSEIPGAGKGLFAYDPDDPDGNEVVFKKNKVIVQYDGDLISEQELHRRYGEWTAPYGVQHKYGVVYTEDGACRRGAGTLANHKPTSRANARLSFGSNKKRFQLVANKDIRNGREIFVSYFTGRGTRERRYQFNEPVIATTVRTRR